CGVQPPFSEQHTNCSSMRESLYHIRKSPWSRFGTASVFCRTSIMFSRISTSLGPYRDQRVAACLKRSGRPKRPESCRVFWSCNENRGLNPTSKTWRDGWGRRTSFAFAPDGLTSVGGYPGDDEKGGQAVAPRESQSTVATSVKHLVLT